MITWPELSTSARLWSFSTGSTAASAPYLGFSVLQVLHSSGWFKWRSPGLQLEAAHFGGLVGGLLGTVLFPGPDPPFAADRFPW